MIESAIYSLLSNDPGIAALIQGGIWPVLMPEQVDYPAISYFCVDSPSVQTLLEASGLAHPRFQVNAWANDYTASKRVIEAVRLALDGINSMTISTASGAVQVRGIRWEDERDTYEHETRTFRTMRDFIVWYQVQ